MVPTPIPSSTWNSLKTVLSGSIVDIVWYVLVVAVLLLVLYVLLAMGPLGAVIGAILASSLISPTVRDAVVDILRRDFKQL